MATRNNEIVKGNLKQQIVELNLKIYLDFFAWLASEAIAMPYPFLPAKCNYWLPYITTFSTQLHTHTFAVQ